ncbi:hypothetical protein, partial [Neisseria sicca]|uniref:hypothetical protein n=1 Tax=Neisseria sicca TaxID=490 RepID=UPI001649B24A
MSKTPPSKKSHKPYPTKSPTFPPNPNPIPLQNPLPPHYPVIPSTLIPPFLQILQNNLNPKQNPLRVFQIPPLFTKPSDSLFVQNQRIPA